MIVLACAMCASMLSWWLSTRLYDPTSHLYLLDHPNERSLHRVPIPRTGGIALLAGAAFGGVLILLTGQWERESTVPWLGSTGSWIIGTAVALAAVSFCDDRWGLPVGVRLAVQLTAAVALLAGGTLSLRTVWVPVVGPIELGWTAWPITIMFLVWMTNLYNFMDGMDGFSGGMTLVGFGFLAYFAWRSSHQCMFILALMVAMGAAGFLVSNFPPARIFMGDVGSIPLGFLAGALALLGQRDGVFDLWVPLVVFSPFIVDATVTVLRRAFQGERVWEAHRAHYYQRLVLSGWGHRKTVLLEYGLMLACGTLALMYQLNQNGPRTIILILWVVTYAVLGMIVRSLEHKGR